MSRRRACAGDGRVSVELGVERRGAWKPVYGYLRLKQRFRPENLKDVWSAVTLLYDNVCYTSYGLKAYSHSSKGSCESDSRGHAPLFLFSASVWVRVRAAFAEGSWLSIR